jgi:hypothetical protein
MKTKQPTKSIFLLGLVLVAFVSCKKQIQIDPPTTSLAPATIFSNESMTIAAQLNLYASMTADPYNYNFATGLSSDEYTNFTSNVTFLNLYKNSLIVQSDAAVLAGTFWSGTYNYIYRINAILEGIANSSGLSTAVKQQTQGEALFTRAYCNFNLTDLYGDVPIVNSTDYKANAALARAPQSEVYLQIIKDLRQAQNLLSTDYLDVKDAAVSPDKIRPTKWAAIALLARAYLYNKNWVGADSAASVLISNSSYQLSPLTGNKSVFMMNSAEAIWQLTPNYSPYSQFATPEGYSNVLTAAPSTGSGITISPQLLSAFEPNDQRKVNWIGSFVQGANTYLFPNKYKDGKSATTLREYTMVLRLAEQFLIRAEARVGENNPSGAIADLNIIRRRAGLSDYAGPTDNSSLSKAILHERQVELFGENHRWFDLRRTGNLDAIMGSPGNTTIAKGGTTWNSYQQYYPIPQSDINVSPNLNQTPGY